jgi:hypothetical protein
VWSWPMIQAEVWRSSINGLAASAATCGYQRARTGSRRAMRSPTAPARAARAVAWRGHPGTRDLGIAQFTAEPGAVPEQEGEQHQQQREDRDQEIGALAGESIMIPAAGRQLLLHVEQIDHRGIRAEFPRMRRALAPSGTRLPLCELAPGLSPWGRSPSGPLWVTAAGRQSNLIPARWACSPPRLHRGTAAGASGLNPSWRLSTMVMRSGRPSGTRA